MKRCLAIAVMLLAMPLAAEEPSPVPTPSFDELTSMSWAELDCLYRQLQPGCMPNGFARGKGIYCPSDRLAHARQRVSDCLWKGKIFCAEDATLVNQWPGVRAIHARIYEGPSWLDGKPSLILDYCGMSHVWRDVRDEMRQVCPGTYLGAMYLRRCPEPYLKVFFVLETTCQ